VQLDTVLEQISLIEALKLYDYPPHRCNCGPGYMCDADREWNIAHDMRNTAQQGAIVNSRTTRASYAVSSSIPRLNESLKNYMYRLNNEVLTKDQRKNMRYRVKILLDRLDTLKG
jgi:hypothetical protein